GEAMAQSFVPKGYSIVPFGTPSDVVVLNTCTVTDTADKECRRLVRRALRDNPGARVVVAGCYAQLKPEEVASIDGVSLVVGNREKPRVADLLASLDAARDVVSVEVSDIASADDFGPAFMSGGDEYTRAFLKIQDGCDYSCAFCTIPKARGPSRSQSVDATIEQAAYLVGAGYAEIVLTGVNAGDYQDGQSKLYDLLERLHNVDGLRRLRVSSIEPNLLEGRIIDLAAASDRFVPHFHMPLQSGSDRILGLMKRRYRSDLFRSRVETIVSKLPGAAIGVDVIAGFPGESEADFEATRRFLADLPIAYLHVFTYSERADTPAAAMPEVVTRQERKRRTNILRELSQRKQSQFWRGQLGTVRPVLFERERTSGIAEGLTDNFIRVRIPGAQAERGTVRSVLLTELGPEGVVGELVTV
ncbi:MAG: tRNA (N(6)-L-threonylcarbamoyladenosine(37)-C(2))-methylthiotransferase MtaB, partial [Myxococcales bacterium]|nr:tRNA (N(6)-L-threonylcarbamoyladenosine(37)-C(2))-methylthiotransferase MtaB [Myxococcales bacterium]